jgi:hypothetical protein
VELLLWIFDHESQLHPGMIDNGYFIKGMGR